MAGSHSNLPKTFDPWKAFDVTPAERQLIQERAQMRQHLKAEFQKKFTDPYRPCTGHIFDPAVQRWYSARATFSEHFRPSRKTAAILVASLIPFGIGAYFFSGFRKEYERKLYGGEIAYKDRTYKFCD